MENEEVQAKVKDLFTVIQQCEEEKISSEHTLSNIAKTHQRIKQTQKLTPYYKTKLKGLYNTAMQDAESEAELLRKALDSIRSIHVVEDSARIASKHADPPRKPLNHDTVMHILETQGETLPLWFGKRGQPAPPLCGAIPAEPNYIANVNDMVAANVNGSNDENMWMMARVTKYFPNTRKYEVEDIDEQQSETHVLSRKKVIPLPLMRANPETHPEALFPVNTLVLAAYPQVTCLYPAIVKSPPARIHDKYVVLFKDQTCENGIDLTPFKVCQKYVVGLKGGRKK